MDSIALPRTTVPHTKLQPDSEGVAGVLATFLQLRGAFVRDLQVVLGHSHLDTTMLYLHAETGRVASPLNDYVSAPNLGNTGTHF